MNQANRNHESVPPPPAGGGRDDAARLLAARMGHEINNVAQSLQANLGAMWSLWQSAAARLNGGTAGCASDAALGMMPELFADMRECLDRINGIVRASRAMTTAGRDSRPVICPCACMAAALRTVRPLAKTTRFTVRLPAGLPGVKGDQVQLVQVFTNLLMNAVRAAGENSAPEVVVRGRMVADWVSLSVADNGPGIPPATAVRLFQPFFSTHRENGGTGLGLFISREMIRGHDGDIRMANRPGGGAVFRVKLPAAVMRDAE